MRLIGSAAFTLASAAMLRRVSRRSGVTDAELHRQLPGDDLVADPVLVCDRAATFDATAAELWPWLVQLGKQRGGWYFPTPLRLVTDRFPGMRGADAVDPRWLEIARGDYVPDYGPGEPWFRVEAVDPLHNLVYLTLRDAGNRHRWPTVEEPPPPGVLALSFGIYVAELTGGRSRVQLRVRCRPARRWRMPMLTTTLAGGMDWITVAPMFAGLRQRLRHTGRTGVP
ncbi:MAG: hypothetical protein ACRDP1_01955 [Nocardioidaceae bacterium]